MSMNMSLRRRFHVTGPLTQVTYYLLQETIIDLTWFINLAPHPII